MMPTMQACAAYLTPHPRDVARTAYYHIRNADGPKGQAMLKELDTLPSRETFDDLLSCDVPRVLRAAYTIECEHPLMFAPTNFLCERMLMMIQSDRINPVDKQALLEVRDRFIGPVDTMPALHARLAERVAAADRSLRAIGRPGPGLYADVKNTAFMLVALKHVANSPLHGPRLLGRTPPRPAFLADTIRILVVLFSVVGAATLVVRSGAVLGAMVGSAFAPTWQTALIR